MKKIILLLLVAMLFGGNHLYAGPATPATSTQVLDVGNKYCPVSGNPVNGKDFVVVDGKRFGVCCPLVKRCKESIEKDTKRYIDKMLKREPELEKKVKS